MKRFKIVLICCLTVLLCINVIVPVSARIATDGSTLEKVEYWSQGLDPWGQESVMGNTGTGYSIAGNCCSYYGMTYALVKMGIYDPKKGDNMSTLVKAMRDKGIITQDSDWLCEFTRIPEVYPDVQIELNNGQERWYQGCGDWESSKAYFKQKYNEGYYIVLCITSDNTQGHFIFIDGFTEDGKTSVGDSAYASSTILEELHTNIYASNYVLFKYKKPCNTQPSIYDGTALRMGSDNDLSDGEVAQVNKLISEWELMGMPEKSKIMERANLAIEGCRRNGVNGSGGLTTAEIQNLMNIQESKDFNSMTPTRVASIVVALVGLVMFAYTLLLMLGYFIDKFNTFLDFSLVNGMTLGKVRVLSKEEIAMLTKEDAEKKGYVNSTKFFIILGIMLLISGLMVSGVLVRYVVMLVGLILK